MRDNKGVSLVELLIAMAIAAIVSGSIGYLLVTSLRMYGKETTDVALQQELQTTLNQVMDYAMESQFVSSQFATGATPQYLALGKMSDDGNTLNANIVWKNGNKLYIILDKSIAATDLEANLAAAIPAVPTNKNLLAENVSEFKVSVQGTSEEDEVDDEGNVIGTNNVYTNPVSLDITLEFTANGAGSDITKKVTDTALLRNRLKGAVYVDGKTYTLAKKTASADSESIEDEETLKEETVEVENEVMLGRIASTEQVDSADNDFTILEIIPNPQYSIMGYLVPGQEPIGEAGLDGVANNKTGHEYDRVQMSEMFSGIKHVLDNDESSIRNTIYAKGRYKGYFMKVQGENPDDGDYLNGGTYRKGGGVYALERDNYGRYTVTGYFKPEDKKGEGRYVIVTGKENEAQNCLEQQTRLNVDGYYEDGDNQIFQFVGKDQQVTYTENGVEYTKPKYDFQFTPKYENGKVTDSGIHFVSEYSNAKDDKKSNNENKYDASDFCYVWVEDNNIPRYGYYKNGADMTKDPDNISSVRFFWDSSNDGHTAGSTKEIQTGDKFCVVDYAKYKIVNNDMFLLYCMGKAVPGSNAGRWVVSDGEIVDSANAAVCKNYWEKHKIEVVSCTPAQLSAYGKYIDTADLIMFVANQGTVYEESEKLFKVEFSNWADDNPTSHFSSDITFHQARRIYDRVINNKVTLAVSQTIANDIPGYAKYESNIGRLYFMLYRFENKNIVYDKTKKKFYGLFDNAYHQKVDSIPTPDASQANANISYLYSGRVLFTDFFRTEYVGKKKAYSTPRFSDGGGVFAEGTKKYKPSDFLRVIESGTELGMLQIAKNEYDGHIYSQKSVGNYNKYDDLFNTSMLSHVDSGSNTFLQFMYNEYYHDLLGFEMNGDEGTWGVYSNQLKFDNNGWILRYKSDGSAGMSWLGSAVQNSTVASVDIIGDIEIVGAGRRYDPNADPDAEINAEGKYQPKGGVVDKTYENSGVYYSNNVEYSRDSSGRKIIYISETEYNNAGGIGRFRNYTDEDGVEHNGYNDGYPSGDGLYVFCIIKTSIPYEFSRGEGSPNSETWSGNNYLRTKQNPHHDDKDQYYRAGLVRENVSSFGNYLKPEDDCIIYKYKEGSGVNEKYVYEFVYQIHPIYFHNYINPDNNGNNYFRAHITAESKPGDVENNKIYIGEDEFWLIVRDDFDLD